MIHVAITGAKGFIGKHLLSMAPVDTYKYLIFEGNLLHKEEVETFFLSHDVEQVIHLAGKFQGDFRDQINNNLQTTQNLLEVGIKHGIKKIIYASTGAVYGNSPDTGSEESDPLQPNTFYGIAKLYAEVLIQYYAQFGLDYCILRFPNVFGPENDKGVMFHFMKGIMEEKRVTIYGTGEQKRDFLHVDDACRAIICAQKYSSSLIANISSPIRLSLNELIALFRERYIFDVEYLPSNNALQTMCLNTDVAKKLLHFDAQVRTINL